MSPFERAARLRRAEMVLDQMVARGVRDPVTLAAMRSVPRHEFVPPTMVDVAHEDRPLPIGEEQTISQPYIVAAMTELAHLGPTSRVLEIGTGSGYQTAVLATITPHVYSVEIVEPLAQRAAAILHKLGHGQVQLRVGDGHAGWPTAAPFDAILITAAPPAVPQSLVEQLAMGGRMVVPVGTEDQELLVLTRTPHGIERQSVFGVRFVPMTGTAQPAETSAVTEPQ